MNDAEYDIAIPGNHEFDFGMGNFLSLTEKANFPYISCNFNKEGELLFDPYIIKEIAGKKIAFIGVTTPETLISSNPTSFEDENGNDIYGFLQDGTGKTLYEAIQKNVDEVREQGADYVVLMSHMGNKEQDAPYNFQSIIENTSGIDAILDGHSHDTDQVTMNDKDGNPVIRSACGTKMQAIGYLAISGEDGKVSCGIYSWNNTVSVPELLGIENEMSEPIKTTKENLGETLTQVIGHSDVDLVIYDPEKKKEDGSPQRVVRLQETNLADLITDAFRLQTGAEIAISNGGGIRDNIPAGDITYESILKVLPFNNQVSVSAVSGQQILDALEWGARNYPEENAALLHASGLTYEIQADVPSSVAIDTDGSFASVTGEYRVTNVMVNGEPLDLAKTYQIAAFDFLLKYMGDGFSMFREEDLVLKEVMLDNQMLIDYIKDNLGGSISEAYADPYGDGRLVITGTEE